MRLAGSPELFDALVRQYAGRGIPRGAAQHIAAEVTAGDQSVDNQLDAFFGLYELLQSKGYSESAAQHLAVEMMEGREPMVQSTRRFAGIYGDSSSDTAAGNPFD
jgi:hypothetical protein